MTLAGLVDTLCAAGLEIESQSLLDALWLATQITGEPSRRGDGGKAPKVRNGVTQAPPLPTNAFSTSANKPESPRTSAVSDPEMGQQLFPNAFASNDPERKASAVKVAGAPPSLDRLALSRALRPFRTPWKRSSHIVLDEEASAEAFALAAIAGNKRAVPVLRSLAERWWTVELVIEDDRAMEVWRDEIRAFAAALQMTGAFGRLRRWRLDASGTGTPLLHGSSGIVMPAAAIGGERQLVLFATHGVSPSWSTGRIDDVLRKWTRHGTVALLQMLPGEWWTRTLLGEADAKAMTDAPGAPTSAGRIAPAWWVDDLADDAIAVPVLPLEPGAINAWARMVMTRGSGVPAHLLRGRADGPAEPFDDLAAERRLAGLRETEPRAFELATVLSALPFTIPVARLVQEAHLGTRDSRPLAALFLSGLLQPMKQAEGAAGEWFIIRDRAVKLLSGALRRSDARKVAAALVARVSEHIAHSTGRFPDLTSFSPNEAGAFDLPTWAQPYAQLAHRLGKRSEPASQARGAIERLREMLPRPVFGRLMRDAWLDRPLSREDDPDLWDILLAYGLTALSAAGERVLTAPARKTLANWHVEQPLWGTRILWVDDVPSNNAEFAPILIRDGAEIVEVTSTYEALSIDFDTFDFIISDMVRVEGQEEGKTLLRALRNREIALPVIIFAGYFARSRERRRKMISEGALAVTNDFDIVRTLLVDYFRDPNHARETGRRHANEVHRGDERRDSSRSSRSGPDWALVLNIDGSGARRSDAGAWTFALALRDLFGLLPDRIELKSERSTRGLTSLIDHQMFAQKGLPSATGYIYLCGGHDRPLGPDVVHELEMLLMRISEHPAAPQIVLIADFGAKSSEKMQIRPSFTAHEWGRGADFTPPQIVAISRMQRNTRNVRDFPFTTSETVLPVSETAIPIFTQHLVEYLETSARSGRLSLEGRAIEDELEAVTSRFTTDLWTQVTGEPLLSLRRPQSKSSLLRPWHAWRADCLKLVAEGAFADALQAASAARIVAPEGLDPDVVAELIIYEAALRRRLDLDHEAQALLDGSKTTWLKSPYRGDAFFHLAALAARRGENAKAMAMLEDAQSVAVAFAVRRQVADIFAPLEAVQGFTDFLDRSIKGVKWFRVTSGEFTLPIYVEDLPRSANASLSRLVEIYLRERQEGREVRIRLDCDPGSFDGIHLGPFDNARQRLKAAAEKLGLDPFDWEDRARDPSYRPEGTDLESVQASLTVERGPRRVFV